MFTAGVIWLLLVPMANMGRGTYIDENALQPGQVCEVWLYHFEEFN